MLALIGYGLLGIVVAIGVVALLVLVLPGDHLAAAPRDVVPAGLPSRPEIGGGDVARVRLPVTLRGYRMVDTDAVLDRLALELERRDHEIDDLRRAAGLPARSTESFYPDPEHYPAPEPDPDAFAADDEVLAVDSRAEDVGPYAAADNAPSHPIAGDPQPAPAPDSSGPAR